uniref:Uncharacterized protein n=1 Tax=Clandestinovirus TaxID=2831644 RepID=A0A8F8KLZ1_9VIRU|nr:hypothetical protein KOM_12_586 [Clandestinovirus]
MSQPESEQNVNNVDQTLDFSQYTLDPMLMANIAQSYAAMSEQTEGQVQPDGNAFLDNIRARAEMINTQPTENAQVYNMHQMEQQPQVVQDDEPYNPVNVINEALNEFRKRISGWINELQTKTIGSDEHGDLCDEIDRTFRQVVYCYSVFKQQFASSTANGAANTKSKVERLFSVCRPFSVLVSGEYVQMNDALEVPENVSVGTTMIYNVSRSSEEALPLRELEKVKLLLGIIITILEPHLNKKIAGESNVSRNWSVIQNFALDSKGYPRTSIPAEVDQVLDIIFERYTQAEFDQLHSFDSKRFGQISEASKRAILRVLQQHSIPLLNFAAKAGEPVPVAVEPIHVAQPPLVVVRPIEVVPIAAPQPAPVAQTTTSMQSEASETVWLPSLVQNEMQELESLNHVPEPLQDTATPVSVVSKTTSPSMSDATPSTPVPKPTKTKASKSDKPKGEKVTKKRKASALQTPSSAQETSGEPAAKKQKREQDKPFVRQIAVQMILCHMMEKYEIYKKGVSFQQWLDFIKKYPGLIECHYKDIIDDEGELLKRFRNAPRKRRDKAYFCSSLPNTYSRSCNDVDWNEFVTETEQNWNEFQTQNDEWMKKNFKRPDDDTSSDQTETVEPKTESSAEL